MNLNLSLVNKLSDISFCDKQCSNVNDNEFKSKLINYIQDILNINIIDRIYVTISPRLFKNISYNQHLISTLTNGNPYLLYLTKIDNINCCFYIDRKLKNGYNYPKIHCVKYRFDDKLFNNTIFTGELVKDTQRRWFFILSDILMVNNELTNSKNILSRYELMNNILVNDYISDPNIEPCSLQIKKLFMYKDLNNLITSYIPSLSYISKGLIFYSLTNKYSNYIYIIPRENSIKIKDEETVQNELRTKHPELFEKTQHIINDDNIIEEETNNTIITNNIKQNNVVFKILNTDISDIYNLYCLNDNDLIKYNIALIPTLKLSKKMKNIFADKKNQLGILMECEYSYIFEKWIPQNITSHSIFNSKDITKIINELNKNNL